MADQTARSVHQLKAETERTRAGLTDTVEQLRASVSETANEVRQRVSPTAIKAEISGYIQSRREQIVEDVMSAARNNPMQAIAVGAAVGYPLMKLARAIPLPILLIGAGLFLTSTKKGKAFVHDAQDFAADLTDQTVYRAQELGGQVSQTVQDAVEHGKGAVGSARDAVRDRVGQVGDTLSAAQSAAKDWVGGNSPTGSTVSGGTQAYAAPHAARATERVSDLADQASRSFRGATDSMRKSAADAANQVSRATASAFDSGMDAARTARDSAFHAARQANRTIGNTVQSNPLLVAGVGLVVGALIASSLPRTDVEDSLVGPARDALKERAKNAAADQFETAKSAATDILDDVRDSARREGLSAEGLDASAQDIGQKIRRVADAGISTAMKAGGGTTESGGRNNG